MATAPPTRDDRIESAVLARASDLDGLAAAGWDEIVEAMPRPTPFLLSGWMEAWWEHYGSSLDLAIHVVRNGHGIVAGFPLAVGSTPPATPVARFVGAPDSTLADVVAGADVDAAVVGGLMATAASEHGLLHLFGLASESHLAGLIDGSRMRVRTAAPMMELDGGWDEVYARKTSARRRSLHRRRWRQLRELGAVEVSVACRGTELERALEEAFRLHALRWDGRHDVSTFGSELGRSFNLAALSALAARGHVRVVTLHVAGRPVAFTCSLTVAGRMYVYRLAFDPAYGHLSPGILTTLEAIRIGADEGASRVEFLRGAERYKLELADRVDPLHEAIVADGGVLPALAGYGLRARTRLRRARARVDDLARRRFRSGGCG